MNIQSIPSRASLILLILLVVSALLVRVWGGAYGDLESWNHDEQIHLRTAMLIYNGEMNTHKMWASRQNKYILYPWFGMYIVALILRLYTGAGSLLAYFLSHPANSTSFTHLAQLTNREALLIGRLTVALAGTLTVPVVYSIGRLIRGRGTALLAAAFIAFNGYHVANCHWLKNDIFATFFLSLAFLYAVKIFIKGQTVHYLLAALFSAFAIASKYNTFPIIFVIMTTHVLRGDISFRKIIGSLVSGKILYFYLMFMISIFTTWPLIYLNFDFFRSQIIEWFIQGTSKHLFAGVDKYAEPRGFWLARLINTINYLFFSMKMVGGMGIYVTVLGFGGIILSFWKKDRRLILLVVFPVLYTPMMIFLASGIRFQDTIPVYPFFAILAAVFIQFVVKAVMGRGWRGRVVYILVGVGVLIPYLVAVSRMDYGYWQSSAWKLGSEWAARNIPPSSFIAYESKTLSLTRNDYRKRKIRRLWGGDVQKFKDYGFDYLVTASRHEHRALEKFGLFGPDHRFGKFYLSLPSEYDLVKSFDLGIIPYKAGYSKIYRLRRTGTLCDSGLNSGLLRHFQEDFSVSSPPILFLNRRGQCEGNTNSVADSGTLINKFLIAPVAVPAAGVQLINGPQPCSISLKIGGKRAVVELQPGEIEQFIIQPDTGFPYIQNSYRVMASSDGGYPFLIKIIPDMFRIGLGYLELGDYEEALPYLIDACDSTSRDWYPRYLLSIVYQQLGMDEKAAGCRAEVESLFPEIRSAVRYLCDSQIGDLEWRKEFKKWIGYDSVWLEERAGCTWEKKEMLEKESSSGCRRMETPFFYLPPGDYRIRCLNESGREVNVTEMVAITLGRNGQLFREWELRGGERNPVIEFSIQEFGDTFTLTAEGGCRAVGVIDKVVVSPSMRSWLVEVMHEM